MSKIFVAILIVGFALQLTSCTKSNSKSIIGTWKVTSVKQGSKDRTSDYVNAGYKEVYASPDSYSYSGQPSSQTTGTGKYSWDNETVLKRNGVDGQSSVTITIKTLDKSNMEFTYTDNGDLWDFTFAKQ